MKKKKIIYVDNQLNITPTGRVSVFQLGFVQKNGHELKYWDKKNI